MNNSTRRLVSKMKKEIKDAIQSGYIKPEYKPDAIVSDCCGSTIDKFYTCNTYGVCPQCKEDCEYITQAEFDANNEAIMIQDRKPYE